MVEPGTVNSVVAGSIPASPAKHWVNIENPTDKTIPTDVVPNGLWAGWMYLGYQATDEEIKGLTLAGAIVTKTPAYFSP